MRKLVMKSLAALLALALLLTVLPATAMTAKAADGDYTSNGVVLFDEDFTTVNNATNGSLVSGHTFAAGYGSKHTIADGVISFASGSSNQYIDFAVSNLAVPVLSSGRCFVGIKVELFLADNTATNRNASVQLLNSKDANGANAGYEYVKGNVTAIFEKQTSEAIGYLSTKELASMSIRIGARGATDTSVAGTGVVVIDRVRISMVMCDVEGSIGRVAQDFATFLKNSNGYFQLNKDLTFNYYTSDKVNYYDVIMGNNAVLDLNGHTLTIADGSTLNAAGNAKIIDSSAEKTGKIVCAEDALTIANSAHLTLPLRTADGYVFVEPSLIADTHIFVDGEQTADAFTLHFRPGFGTLGGVNVRETYLAGGNSGIQMTANITSVDIYGNETKLTYGGSENIHLDDVFNGMYASQNARGKMTFQGFEKYQALKITLKLSAGGVTCTLPTYTVNNTKVTKHFASRFDTTDGVKQGNVSITNAGKLSYTGGTLGFDFVENGAISTGAGKKLVIEFDANVSSSHKLGFEKRGSGLRWYLFTMNSLLIASDDYKGIQDIGSISGEKKIRAEINLETFGITCFVDGVKTAEYAAPARGEASEFANVFNNATEILVSGSGHSASNPFVLDNLLIYTIAS